MIIKIINKDKIALKLFVLMFLFTNLLQMLGALLTMIISYLMFKVITQYIDFKK